MERNGSAFPYKKPAFWIAILAVVLIVGAAVLLLTRTHKDPPAPDGSQVNYYCYPDSPDPLAPTLTLYAEQQRFQFCYSALSSYLACGSYELTADTLTLRTEDGLNTYVFAVKDDTFVFAADRSSPIPAYRYSGDSEVASSPVPDGAVFRKTAVTEATLETIDSTMQPLTPLTRYNATTVRTSYYPGDAFAQAAINAEAVAGSRPRQLPIMKFETAGDLARFRTEFGGDFNLNAFDEVTASMDDAFFADNTVLLLYMTANSGSLRFEVADVTVEAQTLSVCIRQTNNPDTGTMDMAGWFFVVSLPKETVQNVTDFDAALSLAQEGDPGDLATRPLRPIN